MNPPTLLVRQARAGALIVLFFLVWELGCRMFGVSDLVLPRPSQVVVTLCERFFDLWPHLLHTVMTTLIGFALGVVAGVGLGGLIGTSRLAYDTAYPLLIGFNTVPKIAVIPVLVVWFGAGTVPAVLTALVICVFPIVVNVATGLATTEPELEDVLKALGASRLDLFWNVGLPRTMPYLFASLKMAITMAFIGAITSETVASNKGIGTVMLIASSNFDMPLVFAGLFLVSIVGVLFYAAFSWLEARQVAWATRKSDPALT